MRCTSVRSDSIPCLKAKNKRVSPVSREDIFKIKGSNQIGSQAPKVDGQDTGVLPVNAGVM